MVDESEIAEKDKEIAVLKRKLHQKDIFISQQQMEMARLKYIEYMGVGLVFGIARKLSDLTNRVISPSGPRIGRVLFYQMHRLKRHAQESRKKDPELKGDHLFNTYRIESIESLDIDQMEPLRFMAVAQPKVSIIIPTWNRAVYLYYCLKSLMENTFGVPYEVVVVDDRSTDETSELLNRTENIRVIKNESNLGFVKACNKGARDAKGNYLLFLNNDTQVTEDWLKAMVDLTDADQTIGAVGAKLILPDGRLQEAGSIIWRDGSALGYGRSEDPDAPPFCYLRDVDFSSGACLLVRKDIFFKLGGFDEIYSPAYYEDADLCLGIKSLGLRVVYQPEARIIHHEFVSSSKEKSMELCLMNQGKFKEKWAKALEDHLAAGSENVLRARDRRKGMKILVLDDVIPASLMGSGYPRANAILKDLAELGHLVTFFPLSADSFPHQPYTDELKRMGIEVFYGESINIYHLFHERKDFYDAVLISRPHNALRFIEELRKAFPQAHIIYDAEAIYANREINQLRLGGIEVRERKQRKMILKELKPVKYADSIMVTSEYERRQILPFRNRDVFVWGYPLEVEIPKQTFPERKELLFVGGFLASPSPNEDAMLHFARNIFPGISETLGCRLFIVGTNRLDSIRKLGSDSIKVTGYVEDLSVYYERSRIFVVPTRFAAGIPLKLLEAMSHGIPSVVTPLVASQLGLSEGEGVLVGKDDADFAQKVIHLYQNESLWYELQKIALEYVRKNCDPEKMKRVLSDILKASSSA
jgi:GT2 family glycosyltransferase/glycosyltransferase involved in cell wall biosynthesis